MKYIFQVTYLSFLLGAFTFGMGLNAQSDVEFFLDDKTADAGTTIEFDVTVEEFQQVASTQLSVLWDSTILEFDDVTNINAEIQGAFFSSPQGGVANMSWSDPGNLANVNNGNVLFTLVFNVVGQECDEGNLGIPQSVESPALDIEIYKIIGGNAMQVNGISNDGSIMVNGDNCNGGGGDVTFRASQETVDQGQEVCIAFTVENFENVQTAQFTIEYDQALLSFVDARNFNLPALSNSNFNDQGGKIVFSWNATSSPVTRADGTVIFELCFDAIGANGSVANIVLSDDPISREVVIEENGNDVIITPVTRNGSVTIGEGSFNGLEVILGDEFISSNSGFCVPVTVNGFEEILSFAYEINFNTDLIRFDSIRNINLDFLNQGSFNTDSAALGYIRLFWLDNSPLFEGQTVPDGTVIFEYCFTVVGECSPTDIVVNPDFEAYEAEDVDGSIPIVVRPADLQCGFSVGGDVTNESCVDECDGSIDLEVSPDNPNFQIEWSGPTNIPNGTSNPSNLCDGNYEVTVTDPNSGFSVETSFEVESPNAFSIQSVDIENERMGNDGSINITMTGKTADLQFNWDTDPPSSTEDISNLSAGEYSVTITDSETGCTIDTSFTVQLRFTVRVNKTDIDCNGADNGTISVNTTGGSGDFAYNWSCSDESGSSLDSLAAGQCSVTITDQSTNYQIVRTITIEEPSPIMITSDITEDDGSGSGAIDITPSGGTGDYNYQWSNGATTQDLSGLDVGIYYVTITDDNNCAREFGPLVVTDGTLLVVTETSLDEYNGSGVSCNAACDGFIDVQSFGGMPPYNIEWSDGSSDTIREGLCEGTYAFTVTDAEGVSYEETIELTEPEPLAVDNIITNCSSDNNGTVNVQIQGGTKPYMYSWDGINFDTVNTSENLSIGSYTAFVRDANACELMFEFNIRDCTEGDCYEGRPAITPNDDGRNDELVIRCVNDNNNTLQIFNKFGRLVYEEDNYQNTWEGTHMNGNAVEEGTYIWILKVEFSNGNTEVYKGTVTVLRNLR
jgi:gliding motility-associated-like protein